MLGHRLRVYIEAPSLIKLTRKVCLHCPSLGAVVVLGVQDPGMCQSVECKVIKYNEQLVVLDKVKFPLRRWSTSLGGRSVGTAGGSGRPLVRAGGDPMGREW